MGQRGELFTTKIFCNRGRKTYFFNVKENRFEDLFLNIVETNKSKEGSFQRRSIVIYGEEMETFLATFSKALTCLNNKEEMTEDVGSAGIGKRFYNLAVNGGKRGDFSLTITECNNNLAEGKETIKVFGDQMELFKTGFDRSVLFILDNIKESNKSE